MVDDVERKVERNGNKTINRIIEYFPLVAAHASLNWGKCRMFMGLLAGKYSV
jgi:hypothetical protein